MNTDRRAANPYAPPATSEPGSENPRRQWPWTIYIVALLRSVGSRSFVLQTFSTLFRGEFGDRAASTGSMLIQVGDLAGASLGALLADRGFARYVVMLALGAAAAVMLSSSYATGNLVLFVALAGFASLGTEAAHVVEVGYLLRAVTVRGTYLAAMLLHFIYGAGGLAATYAGGLLVSRSATALSAASTLVAGAVAATLPRPAEATIDGEVVVDPLATEPLSVPRTVGFVIMLGALTACMSVVSQSQLPTLNERAPFGSRSWMELAVIPSFVVGLVVPFAAFGWRWRPRTLALSGTLVVIVGGALVVCGELLSVVLVVVGGAAVGALGDHAMFDIAYLPLVRQQVASGSVGLWYGLSVLVRWLALAMGAIGASVSVVSRLGAGAAVLLLLLAGLWWLTKRPHADQS